MPAGNLPEMRALVQRVSQASVTVDSQVAGEIGPGLLVFLGVKVGDTPEIAAKLAGKIGALRLFPDEAGKMNRSVRDIDGQVLVVSQFTLYGDTTRGNRPSFTAAARPELARELYEFFIFQLQAADLQVAAGVFQAHMQVHLVNDGPVTLFCSFGE